MSLSVPLVTLEFSLLKPLGLSVHSKHAACLCSSGTWVLGGGLAFSSGARITVSMSILVMVLWRSFYLGGF